MKIYSNTSIVGLFLCYESIQPTKTQNTWYLEWKLGFSRIRSINIFLLRWIFWGILSMPLVSTILFSIINKYFPQNMYTCNLHLEAIVSQQFWHQIELEILEVLGVEQVLDCLHRGSCRISIRIFQSTGRMP